ncbi:PTS sugar transporter subunit IIA [Actinomyces ruminicola]|uniref:PTS system, mannose-specific IIA component n=1 Tax=Actinomyces ruminicola TaxID=332524 RepID=A0A1G9S288_9ACTO|nr:PTS sugar transporter subunit IIA [Actinomyces ruminicola]SDM29524.1 PTS system, mannose-specific IIA component [Actinomyces ruminicola]
MQSSVAVIVAAHGHLAEGLLNSAVMIAGPQDDVVPISFDPGEGPDDLLAKYADAVDSSASTQYLLLVDLLGGSPYNAAARFAAAREDADVVTGVNLPMLIEVLGRRLAGGELAELVEVAKTSGAAGIKVLSEIFTPPTTTDSDDDEGDEL